MDVTAPTQRTVDTISADDWTRKVIERQKTHGDIARDDIPGSPGVHIQHLALATIIQQANQTAVDDAFDRFIADLDRECGFTAYAPTVRAVQDAKKLARVLAEQAQKLRFRPVEII